MGSHISTKPPGLHCETWDKIYLDHVHFVNLLLKAIQSKLVWRLINLCILSFGKKRFVCFCWMCMCVCLHVFMRSLYMHDLYWSQNIVLVILGIEILMVSRQFLNQDILEIRLVLMPGFWIGYQKYTRTSLKHDSFVNTQLSCCCLLPYHVKMTGEILSD